MILASFADFLGNLWFALLLGAVGFGAGWYTWNTSHPEILFDPAVVELVEAQSWEELQAYVTLKYPDIYAGGMRELEVAWIPQDTQFRVNEYDGSESIETRDSVDWITA